MITITIKEYNKLERTTEIMPGIALHELIDLENIDTESSGASLDFFINDGQEPADMTYELTEGDTVTTKPGTGESTGTSDNDDDPDEGDYDDDDGIITSNETIIIKYARVPGSSQEIRIPPGEPQTVQAVLDRAGARIGKDEMVTVQGVSCKDFNTRVKSGDLVVVSENITGNRR